MAARPGDLDNGSDHPRVDVLVAYVRGDLTPLQAEDVRAHVAGCVDCGDQLAALILLREGQLNTEGTAAPQATVTSFPVPPRAPTRRRRVAVAAAAVLILTLAWFAWPTQVFESEPQPLVAAGPALPAVEFEATDSDRFEVMDAVDFLGIVFNGPAPATTMDAASDRALIAEALQAVTDGDLTAARDVLEPFAERWDTHGTAVLGYVLFLLEDASAYPVLEMYAAEHPTQVWQGDALSPEDLAFFFVARLRHAIGDDAGAREAVGWIDPRMGAGPAAVAWLQGTLGDVERDPEPDTRP